jgi:hypothetical protein
MPSIERTFGDPDKPQSVIPGTNILKSQINIYSKANAGRQILAQ